MIQAIAEGAKYRRGGNIIAARFLQVSFRAFSAKEFRPGFCPGPLAQAVTFRAFGALTRSVP